MDRYIVNVEAAIVRDGRYLMIVRGPDESHAPGALSLPGGKVEDAGFVGNVLEETLRREIREEVGIEAGDLVYIESKSFVADDGDHVIDIVFLRRYLAGELAALDTDEVAGVTWMTAADVLSHSDTTPWVRQSITLSETRRASLGW